MFKEDLVNVYGRGRKVREATRILQKRIEEGRRDEEDRSAYVMSSYHKEEGT